MTRYKGRTRTSQRDFPHRVEMIVPKGGFDKRLDEMHEWHRARSIRPRFGRSRRDANNRDYVTWCFADAAIATVFDLIHPVVNDQHSLRAIASKFSRKRGSHVHAVDVDTVRPT